VPTPLRHPDPATPGGGRPAPEADANRFRSTRESHRDETAEDYVEAIEEIAGARGEARVSDLARTMGVSHVTVTRIIARLQREGLVETEPYRPIGLTDKGRELAAMARDRHEVVLGFLLRLGVSREQAEIDAEGIEHHCSEETVQAMRRAVESGRLRPR